MRKLTITALMSAMLATVPVASVLAAQQQQAPAAATQQAQPVNVSDEQLEQFAGAQETVNEIRVDAMAKLEKVEDQNEAQEIQQQANEDMVSAVKDSGLSVEDYNLIARAVQSDTKLAARLKEMGNG
ncbi:DUF4168 domain-containing protein [Shewanella sp. C32]|uniref:DUF4168 domain-containing protein n=1 Tax=Shewanella electrica TaxID=515560 RepID=A0ABT2FJ83_9GAMM|nr:DUF4168 domain-containing protein [Shewanella electrica]MCH1923624.1 DUF4168 domain-containing protein [Shewanella electrica]MCS4555720.1 DUF4168 domain-containing protein [Shewanella electrica]